MTDGEIGEVPELVRGSDGRIARVPIDVGGFLGIGGQVLALTTDEVQIVRSDAGDDVRVHVDMTKEDPESRPGYVR